MKTFVRRLVRFAGCNLPASLLLFLALAPGLAWADERIKVPLQTQRSWDFEKGQVRFDCNFSGARLNGCEQTAEREFQVVVSPENQPINPSPWFAFKVSSDIRQTITLRFVYTYDGPRGRPWLSRNGADWSRTDRKVYQVLPDKKAATLQLEIGPQPTWVASCEVMGLGQLNAWTDKMCRLPFAREDTAGLSIEGRPLRAFVLGETTNANYVFVIGRQHPPEVTGTMGLSAFVETVAESSALARRFRRQFQIVVLPVANPDGVEHGHWRSNLGAVDLNRDWQNFSQPETVALRDWLLGYLHRPNSRPALFLDFHSTGTNVFYAVPEEKGDAFAGFADNWLAALRRDCPPFIFERDDAHNAGVATAKSWAHQQLRAPSITCEFGYDTDRKLIRRAARAEAEDMMRLLLAGSADTKAGAPAQPPR